MTNPPRDPANLSYGALIGATVSVAFLTILIVVADLEPAVKDWLKLNFSHHWVGKGLLATVALFLSGAFFLGGGPRSEHDHAKAGHRLYVMTIAASIVLLMFFLYEAFLK
jgi:hypothetical protein